MLDLVLLILAGLVLFLYAVRQLSESLQRMLGAKARVWISKRAGRIWSSLLVGIVFTALLGSSSALIIIAIVFVNSRLLTLRQAMGIVMGANIGTTVSSQIFALDISQFSPVIMAIGMILLMVARNSELRQWGEVVLYFGVLFFGLFIMEFAVEPYKENAVFVEWLKKTENPWRGAALGALVTLIIQSSSATMGMAIVLAKTGTLTLAGGIAIMIGAELGTVSDTLLATIHGSRAALKTALFHLFFNLISIVLGLLFFGPLVEFIQFISGSADIDRMIANGHMLFNSLGVLLFVWTIPIAERLLNRLV